MLLSYDTQKRLKKQVKNKLNHDNTDFVNAYLIIGCCPLQLEPC